MGSTYHHGDLPSALLEAVDSIVRERDVAGVSLREAARRAGVSHAAPAYHFGDKAGLLTAYAEQGFADLRDRLLESGRENPVEGGRQLFAMGVAYLRFALAEPGRFKVMFRPEALRSDDSAYRQACDEAFAVLRGAVAALRPDLQQGSPQLASAAVGAWSLLHGFSTLWLDGDLDPALVSAGPEAAASAVLEGLAKTLRLVGDEPADPRRVAG